MTQPIQIVLNNSETMTTLLIVFDGSDTAQTTITDLTGMTEDIHKEVPVRAMLRLLEDMDIVERLEPQPIH
jgi:hypothetical protein